MVNIIDCIRNVVTDKYAFIKIAILAIPAIISTHALMSGQMVLSITLNIVFGIIFAAVFFETIRRSCNSEPMLLPTFLMPVRMFITLGFTILAAIPIVIVNILLFLLFVFVLAQNPQLMNNQIVFYIVYSIFYLLLVSLFFASITQYLDTGKLYDAYKPMRIIKALSTFIVNLFAYAIQAILFMLVAFVLPAWIILMLNGMNPMNFFFILYMCMFMVFNYLVFADYIGQTKKDSESPYNRLF